MAYRQLIPIRALAKLYTLWSRLFWVPQLFLDSRTVFLPKAANADSSKNLRLISISSVFLRQFHKILNKHFITIIHFSKQQFGIHTLDGIGRFIDQLDSIFSNFKSFHNSCSAVFIDLILGIRLIQLTLNQFIPLLQK